MKIVVIDYGMGNLASVFNALKFLGASARVSEHPSEIEKADKIVLPGVGAFHDAISGLRERGLVEPIKKSLSSGKPYLGICLGLQLLFEESEEAKSKGLGIFKGKVKRFSEKDGIKVPQIGWNTVRFAPCAARLADGIKSDAYFYFDHSYYGDPEDKNIIAGTTDYGVTFASMISKDNIWATQFHPERSQTLGLKLLENFIKL